MMAIMSQTGQRCIYPVITRSPSAVLDKDIQLTLSPSACHIGGLNGIIRKGCRNDPQGYVRYSKVYLDRLFTHDGLSKLPFHFVCSKQ